MKKINSIVLITLVLSTLCLLFVGSLHAQKPDRELGYFNGQELEFSADLGIPQKVPAKVQGNVFLVVYPIGFQDLGLADPQCNPCDHLSDGITFDDFHDHILDSIPGVPGYTALKHVSAVLPNYSFLSGGNNPARDAAISQAYASHLPATSTEEVEDLLNSTAPDGSPLAIRSDLGIYIRLSVNGINPR
jgi:hypothetical protein